MKKKILEMVNYIESEFGCKTCYSSSPQINSLFPELRSAHLAPSCNRIKRVYAKSRQCIFFENTVAIEHGKKTKNSFAKMCPFGIVEIAAPIYFKQFFFGIFFAGEFSFSKFVPVNFLKAPQKIKPNLNLVDPPPFTEDIYRKLIALMDMAALAIGVYIYDNLNAQDIQLDNKEFIQRFINGNFRNQIDLHDIAQRMDWTEEYTSRQIKKLFGKGFSQLLNETRLSNAKWLLSESTLRIKDVAAFSGFYDSLYFSRVFRKNFQTSPSEYRKKETVTSD